MNGRGYLWEDLHSEVEEMFAGCCIPLLERRAFAIYAEKAIEAQRERVRDWRANRDAIIRCLRRRKPIFIPPCGRPQELEAKIMFALECARQQRLDPDGYIHVRAQRQLSKRIAVRCDTRKRPAQPKPRRAAKPLALMTEAEWNAKKKAA